MTTNNLIFAGCGKDKEVSVVVTENGAVVENFTMQDQEKRDIAVYDGREISIKEVEKFHKVTKEEREGCFEYLKQGRVVCNGEGCEHHNLCFKVGF